MRSELALGTLGVQVAVPPSWEVVQEGPRFLVLRDNERGLVWQFRTGPWRLDLEPSREDVLRRDVELFARGAFDADFARAAAEPKPALEGFAAPPRPRTADPAWSPVVSQDRVELRGGAALRTLRRLSYSPGRETLLGALVIPVEGGIFEVIAAVRAETTGFRESAVMLMKSEKGKPPQFFPQSVYDDPELDAAFPKHALSRLRAGLAAIEPGLEVTRPAAASRAESVSLPSAGCSLVPPARFLPLAPGSTGMSPSLVLFTRVALGSDGMKLFDVWRYGDEAPSDAASLAAVAERVTRGWEKEGAKVHAVETAALETKNGWARASCFAEIDAAGSPSHGMQMWLSRPGMVFRVSASAPPFVPRAEIEADVEAAAASLSPT